MNDTAYHAGLPTDARAGDSAPARAAPSNGGGSGAGEPINILLVDDEPKNLTALEAILTNPDYRLVRAQSADEALLALIADQYALIILDIRLPDMTGLELAQMIKERKKTARVPIIFLTAYYSEDQHILEGYGAGAVDYLHKPVNATILRSKVAVFAELHRKTREALITNQALLAEVTHRRHADEQLRELNETLEQRVAARTAELLESRARLKHAVDLAKLTYFDLDYAQDQITTADNFVSIMGFSLPEEGAAASVAAARETLHRHVAPADRRRFVQQTENTEGPFRKIEYRVIGDDDKERWIESEWHFEMGPDGRPIRVFAANIDITERKQSEEQRKILMAEINHRSKNLLAVVQAIVNQSARYAEPHAFAHTLSLRLQGLSASQDLLSRNNWRGIELSELVAAQLAHFKDIVGTRIVVEGPPAQLTAAGAQAIGMALHELATNAVKHGSLASEKGRVHIWWSVSGKPEAMFSIRWSEDGGAPVSTPSRKGFGHLVIGSLAEAALNGKVVLDFRESGLSWKLSALAADALEAR
ncbi:MAG: response regulator [Hyphomicrobiales bacterium]|nr:response regulator [Hyphomicrobiales bacterium]